MTGSATTEEPAEGPRAEGEEDTPYSDFYTRYALGLLLAISIINYLDRQVINILAEPIKNSLGLADWQLGMMTGLAFAVFYTFMGIPIARLADRKSRPLIIGVATAVWCGFTALCGLAQNFLQLVVLRILVGVGEAGCSPPAHSLIVDYVSKRRRASSLAFFAMGNPLGGLVGLMLGGVLADAFGWRTVFFLAGVPGLLLAVLALTTLREPRARAAVRKAAVPAESTTLRQTAAYLARKPTFWRLGVAMGAAAYTTAGHTPFTASFFLRVHDQEVASLATFWGEILGFNLQSVGFLGLAIGLAFGVCGACGIWLGGWLSDKWGERDSRAYLTVPMVALLISFPLYLWAMTTESAVLALVLVGLNSAFTFMPLGPAYRTAQSIVPPHMRATTAALMLFAINLIGQGLGPLSVGVLSDALNHMGLGSGEGVRWALILSNLAVAPSCLLFWSARKTIRRDEVM